MQTDKLSTKFGDWIEKDLLKLNPIDIRSIQLNDYSVGAELNLEGRQTRPRAARHDGAGVRRNQERLDAGQGGRIRRQQDKPVADELKEDEELNNEKLAAMKTALDDLQIVDVERKPPGMKQLAIDADVPRGNCRPNCSRSSNAASIRSRTAMAE